MAILNTNVGPERVQTFDQPLGVVQVPGAGTAVAGILISTSKAGAPLNAPTRVQSLTDFVETFGESDWIGDGISTGLRALDSVDDLTLVMVPGLPLETAYLVHPAVIDYSETVRAEFGAALTTVFSLVSIPDAISSAQSDELQNSFTLDSTTPVGDNFELTVGVAATTQQQATGTITINTDNIFAAGSERIYVIHGANNINFTSSASAGPQSFLIGATASDTAQNLADAINAQAAAALIYVIAGAAGEVVTITADITQPSVVGSLGNAISVTSSDGPASTVDPLQLTTSASALSGGQDASSGSPQDLSEITPGMLVTNTADDFLAVVTAVDDVLDTLTIAVDPTTSFDADSLVHVSIPSAITYKETVVNNPSRFAAWYYNTLTVLDSSTGAADGATVTVDPVGHVAGVMSRMDSNLGIGGVSHAPAGIKYAGIAGIQGLRLQISERLDGGALRLNFINRITSFPGAGNVIFGGYTADSGTSPLLTADEQLIQVMRTLQFIKASLDVGLRSFLWENFSPDTQAQVASSIQSFLRNNIHLFPAGLAEAQQFKVISVEATQDELDQGLLRVRVQLRPNKAVRFIEIALEYPIPVA